MPLTISQKRVVIITTFCYGLSIPKSLSMTFENNRSSTPGEPADQNPGSCAAIAARQYLLNHSLNSDQTPECLAQIPLRGLGSIHPTAIQVSYESLRHGCTPYANNDNKKKISYASRGIADWPGHKKEATRITRAADCP